MNDVSATEHFRSILWQGEDAADRRDDVPLPDCFHDLNLDQVVDAITAAWPAENLTPFFRAPLPNVAAVTYRQAVLRDVERQPMRQALSTFVARMRDTHARLARIDKLDYHYEKERARLGAATAYGAALQGLSTDLEHLQPDAPGLRALHAWLVTYMASDAYVKLTTDMRQLLATLNAIRYELVVRNNSITVRNDEQEADAKGEIEALFAKFRRDTPAEHADQPHGRLGVQGLNHIEAQVLEKVALLNPQAFATLDAFCTGHEQFVDPTIDRFAREVCVYLAWLAYIDPLRSAGLSFCEPVIDAESKAVTCEGGFDLALAANLVRSQQPVVRNDFALGEAEHLLVVSGPNHGGKTTFARMFGQLHWLAALGLTVPGTRARLLLFDHLFTHFEREEDIATLRGKLKDDLVRIHHILAQATPRSLVILNEIFASTTLDDALRLGRRIMMRLSRLGALSVCVTFLTELASFDADTVSMVAAIDPDDPAIRTFKLERRPADGLAYALAIARKYRVTRSALLERIAP